ncbi:MAG TPA: hypothetical protein VKR22_00360, partial [Acidimicrobiales bacterium]|nr:hypothetical protein [Acidimicrobiales bacterium]
MRILVLCFDPVTEAMAGPALRAWRLAEVLAGDGHDVVLASTVAASAAHADVRVVHSPAQELGRLVSSVDAVFAPTSVA